MLEAIFTTGIDEIEVSGLTQWDRGQKINITIPGGLPSMFQVHFTFRGGTKALNVSVFDSTEVGIPDELLTQPLDLVAYVYLITEDSGETVKTIHLPMTPRQKPEDYSELPPSFQERVDTMLLEFNDKVNDAVDMAWNAERVAVGSVQSAADSASAAQAAAEAAQKAAEDTKEAAQLTEGEVAALMGDIDCGTFTGG